MIPTDSGENTLFQKSLLGFENHPKVEILPIGQQEGTSRAERLNMGFHKTKGELVLFHHPRSFLPPEAINHLIELSCKKVPEICWGGFLHQFDKEHMFLRLVSWYSNSIRFRRKGIVYLDHCIFFDRRLWKTDLKIQYIFEDTELSLEFCKISWPILLPYPAITSAHRFEKNGIMKQLVLNQILKLGYFLKIPSSFLYSLYQR
ncbi:glycosyltransferase family protein [Leptospira soteropolitanensis]|uniref:Glycosyltransferase n=1 Tax=Leptospira soteropolitanensis TaxID=2950025 RepID=A0AAW5VJ27_9LEPT|nr:hypothetical protein [Leptospira soteropolitanensis]MCW7500919.1 hypothetical protein [Leptospira soteropolitanensis]MCW7523401.1 hypothetical protein [Leptospira soteropolitanensis]MCW7531119.1 hypothetical protein [Leptospira soteropolitanensis]